MTDSIIPKSKACSLFTFPVGIGLKQVLVINLSRSASYHIFSAPAAPAPIVTKKIATIEFKKETDTGAVSNPTAQVKITKDITLGFINNNRYLKYDRKLIETDFFLIVFTGTITQHLVKQILQVI